MNYILKCPVCDKPLEKRGKSFACEHSHSFDIAKQGYVNVLQSQTSKIKIHGDSSDMLQARKTILYKGYYHSISHTLNEMIGNINSNRIIIDIGSGIGYYMDKLEQAYPESIYYGIDISKDGVKEAAKNNKNVLYTVGTNNKLPYLSNSADIIYAVFSPIKIGECIRVLKPNGHLITVSPNTNHLMELKELVYDEIIDKDYEVNEIEEPNVEKVSKVIVKDKVHITNGDLFNLFMMTPHFWKTGLGMKEKIEQINEFYVSIDVVISLYKIQ
jgi:23S rRNA (guanine745-N1)-methyltransferase